MKLEIQVEQNQVGASTVEDIFKSLTLEQKQDIVRQCVLECMAFPRPDDIENEKERLNKKYNYSEWRVKEGLEQFTGARRQMVDTIIKESVAVTRKVIEEVVQSDPIIVAARNEIMEHFKAEFPKMCHDAIAAFFCQEMSKISSGMLQAMMQSERADNTVRQIEQNMRNRGIY